MLNAFRIARAANSRASRASHPATPPAASLYTQPKMPFAIGETFPNLHVLNARNTIVPLYGEIQGAPSVIVKHSFRADQPLDWRSFREQLECDERLKGYEKAINDFDKAKVRVLFLCLQNNKGNIPATVEHCRRLPFQVYMAALSTLDAFSVRGYDFDRVNGILYGKPSTTILSPDQTIVGHTDAKGVAPAEEAERTLEYILKQKLFINEPDPKKKLEL